jgi:two-component system, LuxR family, sensor kinase FixL
LSTKILIVVTDAAGKITQANSHCEAMTGFSPAELIGKPIWDCLPAPETAGQMRDAFTRVAAGDSVHADEEARWLRKDGTPLSVLCNCLGRYDADGLLQTMVISAFDIGRARSIATELGEALDRHQGILDTAVDAIITIDQHGNLESFNRAAERIFGYRAAEVVGRNISMLMPQPYRGQHDGYLQNYLTTRRKKIIGIGREVEGLRKDGTVFPMELAVGEVALASGRTFTGIVRDISDRKAAEQEARRRLNEMAHIMRLRSMGELAAGLAHEINQPLTAIVSSAQACQRMIAAGNVEPELLRDALGQIAAQGVRAAEVIRRLRRLVEKGELEKRPQDLANSVTEVLALFAHELRVHMVQVNVAVPEGGVPEVNVDRVQIEQVVVNLIRNALDAMEQILPSERLLKIALSTALNDGRTGLLLRVQDHGTGIAPEIAEHLFEPFQTTKRDGLGQGLAICRRIVEAHGGRIWVETVVTGGTAFLVWLPLAAP